MRRMTLQQAIARIAKLEAELAQYKVAPIKPLRPDRVQALIDAICHRHQVSEAQVFAVTQRQPAIAIRQEIWWHLRKLRSPAGEQFSYPLIGRWFERDPSTIHYGVREYERRLVRESTGQVVDLVA